MKYAAVASTALIAATLFSACATAGDSKQDKPGADPLAGYERTGEKTSCLMLSQVSQIKPVSDELFLVRVGVNDWYLNEVKGSCDGAASSFTRLEYRTSTSSLCALQIVNVVDNTSGIFRGSCSLGDFEKLKKTPTAPAQ